MKSDKKVMPKRNRFTEILEQLVADITIGLTEAFGHTPEEARKRAEFAINRIQEQVGGSTIYFTKKSK